MGKLAKLKAQRQLMATDPRAAQLRKETYTRAEVYDTLAYRDEQFQQYLRELQEYVFNFTDSLFMMKDIDYIAAVFRGQELKERLPISMAGALSDKFTQYAIIAESISQPVDSIRPMIFEYVDGIRALHNEDDDGAALRAINHSEAARAIAEWRAGVQGGRPKGTTEWKEWLRAEWLRHETTVSNPATVKYLILNDIATYKNQIWVLKPEHESNPVIARAFSSLNNKTANNRPDQFRVNLFA